MKQLKKSLTVPTIIICTLSWAYFSTQAYDSTKGTTESDNVIRSLEDVKKNSIAYQYEQSYNNIQAEYERLKEEERKRLEELKRQRLERLEKIRLAKIEEAKKLEQQKQKKLEEQKKQQQVVSRGSSNKVGNWRTFNASYYGSNCYKCSGITAVGIDVRNTIYYKGYRIIALDPKVIPLWSIVEVKTPNEHFKAIVGDTGGRIVNFNADILVESEEVSKSYGRHDIQIRVIGKFNK